MSDYQEDEDFNFDEIFKELASRLKSDFIHVHSDRTVPLTILITDQAPNTPVRDAQMLDTLLSTTLPEDAFNFLIQTFSLRQAAKTKHLKEKIEEVLSEFMQEISIPLEETLDDPPTLLEEKPKKTRKKKEDQN